MRLSSKTMSLTSSIHYHFSMLKGKRLFSAAQITLQRKSRKVPWVAGYLQLNRSTLAQQKYQLGNVISFQIYSDVIICPVEEGTKDDTNQTYVSQRRE